MYNTQTDFGALGLDGLSLSKPSPQRLRDVCGRGGGKIVKLEVMGTPQKQHHPDRTGPMHCELRETVVAHRDAQVQTMRNPCTQSGKGLKVSPLAKKLLISITRYLLGKREPLGASTTLPGRPTPKSSWPTQHRVRGFGGLVVVVFGSFCVPVFWGFFSYFFPPSLFLFHLSVCFGRFRERERT